MRSLFAATYILACSSAAVAQQLTVTVDGTDRITVSPRDCGSSTIVRWTLTLSPSSPICTNLNFWISTSSCGDAPAGDDLVLTPQPLTGDRSGQFSVSISSLPIFNRADGGFACGAAMNQTHNVCGFLKYASFLTCGTSDVPLRASAVIDYRGKPPDPPTITDLSAQDSALTVRVSSTADAVTIHAQLRVAGSSDDFAEWAQFSATVGSAKLGNLQNGTTYEVRVIAEDAAGNFSNPSDSALGTPIASEGFFGEYRRLGGRETGGCGSALPLLSVPLALGGYRLLRRRSCRRDS